MLNPINLKPMSDQELLIYKLVTSKYLNTDYGNGRVMALSNNCIDLDKDLKKISDELVLFRKSQDKQMHIDFLMYANKIVSTRFNGYDCRNRIEETRLESSANLQTQFAIKQEQSVLGKSSSETNVYLVIGSLVILSVLVILIRNK
jgi:hypothetical protein